jgi:hypothetical protein
VGTVPMVRRWNQCFTWFRMLEYPSVSFLAELKVPAASSQLYRLPQREFDMKKKIDIAAIPELATSVGMHGSVKQKEVGGPACLGIAVAIMIAL